MLFRQRTPTTITIIAAGSIFLLHTLVLVFVPSADSRMFVTDILTPLVDLLAGVAMLWAGFRLLPHARRLAGVWLLLGAAQLFTAAGDTGWLVQELWLHNDPLGKWSEILYLVYYPIFLLGVLHIPQQRASAYEVLKPALDVLIILLAAGLGLWNFMLGPMLQAGAETPLQMVMSMAYPIGDLLLLVAMLMILYRPGERLRGPAWTLLLAAGTLIISFDVTFAYLSAAGLYQSGMLPDASYTLGNLLFGLAGVYQAVRAPQEKDPSEQPALQPRRQPVWQQLLPYIWVAAAYALLALGVAVGGSHPLPMSLPHIILSVGVIIGLVLVRQVVMIHENSLLSNRLQHALGQLRSQARQLAQANQEMSVEIQERRRAEARLSYDALHDGLTGLPNRALFLDRLAHAAQRKKRSPGYQYAVLFLDLDSFKVVNDSLGHITGDELLIQMARILQGCLRSTDMIARLGGDEFVILLDDVHYAGDVIHTADRLQAALAQPVALNSARVFTSVSIGIVQDVDGYEHPEDILRDADLAMYQAKSRGKARYEIFHTTMRESALSRLALENDLRRAVSAGEFVLHYQPILALPEQQLEGFEALVRWQHPERGLLLPAEFIPIAEETGLILPLGRWILFEACRQASAWQAGRCQSPLKMNVNISGKQLKQPDFVSLVAQALCETALPPGCLALEVTETVCLDSLETVAETLQVLHALGVETQIDDFGTGYSSLSYLQQLPVQMIKIPRAFIQSIDAAEVECASTVGAASKECRANGLPAPDVIRAIFSLVNNLGIKTVAEGIENEAQLAELSRLNCAYGQGFLLALPMPAAEADRWMRGRGN